MTGDVFPPLVLLCDLSVKSALLLLAAWGLTLGMRRASAAARHLVWLLAFAGLLLLPLLSVTLPSRAVPVLPPPAAPSVPSPVVAPPVFLSAPPNAVPDNGPAVLAPASFIPARTRPPTMPTWPALLGILWLAGVALAAFPLIAGWLLAVQRIRRCSPVTDPATLALAAEAGRQLGVRRPVPLRSGPRVAVPVTFGLLGPVVLLPDGAASWPADRLRVALLHEMAHVRRGDWAVQTTARLVCALFWHNPLVWPAARMLRAEAERACDDRVLLSGVPGPDYAQHLLAVAGALSGAGRPLPLAVPMAGRGAIESRLRAVLTARPRRAPSRGLAALSFLLALVVLVPLTALRPVARAARRTDSPLLPVAPPVPPEVIRPSFVPVGAAVAAPPSPVPTPALTQPKPIGVPPMKPPMPVKAALTAFVAGLALPAAHAQPGVPIPPKASASQNPVVPTVAPANPLAKQYVYSAGAPVSLFEYSASAPVSLFEYSAHALASSASSPTDPSAARAVPDVNQANIITVTTAPDLTPNPLVTLDLKKVPIRQALDTLFTAAKANYTVAADVPDDKDLVTVHLTNVPFIQALDAVLAASDTPLTFTVGEGGIFAVRPRRTHIPFGTRSGPAFYEPDLPGASPYERTPSPFTVSPMILGPLKPGSVAGPYKTVPNRTLFLPKPLAPTHNDGTIEQQIVALLADRATKLVGGVTPNHPDIVALDARIARLQRRLRAGANTPTNRSPVNPAPNKFP